MILSRYMARSQLSTGVLELLKWLGVLLMIGDHIAAIWRLQLAQRKKRVGSCAVFVLAGLVVEYSWPGIGLVMAAVYLLQKNAASLPAFFLAWRSRRFTLSTILGGLWPRCP